MTGRPLNKSQCAVIIVGLGAVLYTFGLWFTGLDTKLNYGWVAYSPLSNRFDTTGLHPWLRLLIWIVLIVLWVVASATLLKEQ